MELKKLSDDFLFWDKNRSFDVYEIASRLHHRAVQFILFKMEMVDTVEC